MDVSQEEEDMCRICRSPEEPGNPLMYPCLCRGSIKSDSSSWMSPKLAYFLAGLLYCSLVASFMTIVAVARMGIRDANVRRFTGNGRVIDGVVLVLWKHMTILCVWYVQKLIHILGLPPGLIVLPPNAQIHEFGVIRRLLFFLDDDTFALLAISVYVSILFVLLPVWIGWIVLATVGGSSYSSGNSLLIFQYMMMLSSFFACFGFLFTLPQISFPAIVRWFWLGCHFLALKLPCLLWGFSVKSCKTLCFGTLFILCQTSFPDIVQWFSLGFHFIAVTLPLLLWVVIKYAFVLCLKIGVLPWIIGCWLEICTSPFFGTRFYEILSDFLPFMTTTLRWCYGTVCLFVAASFMKRIQEIVHKRAFWFLLDVTDPDYYKITKLNLGYIVLTLASHGVLLVVLFYLPVRAITLISPSFFPLELWVKDETLSLGVHAIYSNLVVSSLKWLIGLTKPAMELIVQSWTITVNSWLKLSDFLLVVPHRADQNVRPVMQPRRPYADSVLQLYSLAEGSVVILHGSQNAEDDQRDNRFLLRVALMLVPAALSFFVLSTAFLALPILLGRGILEFISFIMPRFGLKRDDLCAFWIGYSIMGEAYIITCFVSDQIHKGRIVLLLKDVTKCIRNGLLFSIWITVIPGLLGLLIDLMIIIPTRVPLNESPVYFLIQDWLIGVVVLHIWAFLTMLTPINWFATEAWRRKLERIRNVGVNRLPTMWLLRDMIGSIISTLLITLSIPYLLVKSLFPLLGFQESVTSAVERLMWPALLALIAVWFMAKLACEVIIYLHKLVFNERYLVGERLGNLTEEDI